MNQRVWDMFPKLLERDPWHGLVEGEVMAAEQVFRVGQIAVGTHSIESKPDVDVQGLVCQWNAFEQFAIVSRSPLKAWRHIDTGGRTLH